MGLVSGDGGVGFGSGHVPSAPPCDQGCGGRGGGAGVN